MSSSPLKTHVLMLQTIETLDERSGVPRHHLWSPPLSPPPPAAEDEPGAGDSEPEAEPHPWELLLAQQRLADVLEYLRGQHSYCLFCGCQVTSCFTLTCLCTMQCPHDKGPKSEVASSAIVIVVCLAV